MAGAAVLGRLTWRLATVSGTREETAGVRSIELAVPGWPGHLPGQHVDVRLTAEDGYQAQRSYSIAAPADGDRVELTVERIADGEVSPYLVDELRSGDAFELRGPIGGYFVWEPEQGGPVQLVAGGSGVVPLRAILRRRAEAGGDVEMRLLASSRSWDEVIYRDELERLGELEGIEVAHTLTRSAPEGWTGYARRVDRELLAEFAFSARARPISFVCGPTGFVEAVANALVDLGHDPARVRTERFGPSGS